MNHLEEYRKFSDETCNRRLPPDRLIAFGIGLIIAQLGELLELVRDAAEEEK